MAVAITMNEDIGNYVKKESENDQNSMVGVLVDYRSIREYFYTVSSTPRLATGCSWYQVRSKGRRICYMESVSRQKNFSLEISKISAYVKVTNTRTVGILQSDSHADTVCAIREFGNLLVTGVFYEVGLFGRYLDNHKSVEVSTSTNSYDDPITRTIYLLVFFQ